MLSFSGQFQNINLTMHLKNMILGVFISRWVSQVRVFPCLWPEKVFGDNPTVLMLWEIKGKRICLLQNWDGH